MATAILTGSVLATSIRGSLTISLSGSVISCRRFHIRGWFCAGSRHSTCINKKNSDHANNDIFDLFFKEFIEHVSTSSPPLA